jgi:hypothetical protein
MVHTMLFRHVLSVVGVAVVKATGPLRMNKHEEAEYFPNTIQRVGVGLEDWHPLPKLACERCACVRETAMVAWIAVRPTSVGLSKDKRHRV